MANALNASFANCPLPEIMPQANYFIMIKSQQKTHTPLNLIIKKMITKWPWCQARFLNDKCNCQINNCHRRTSFELFARISYNWNVRFLILPPRVQFFNQPFLIRRKLTKIKMCSTSQNVKYENTWNMYWPNYFKSCHECIKISIVNTDNKIITKFCHKILW